MISLYSSHGRYKRVAKFRAWSSAMDYILLKFGTDPKNPELDNYFFKVTKT